MPNIIRVGDPTDHGGRVLASGAPHYTVDGIAVALVGDPCSCPMDGHAPCVIVEGDAQHTVGGIPVAYAGCKTSCGAALQPTAGQYSKG